MVWLHRQTLSCLALGLACLVSKRLVIAQEFAGSPVDADAPIDPAVQGSAALPFPLTSPQLSPPYSLDIIDTRVHALDFFYQYDFDGSDVNVYIMSTGIRSTHAEFQQSSGSGPGRVLPGWSFDGDEGDCVGYGTHAAGVVGGLTYGVAKDVNMYPVKIFQGCETGSTTTTAEILQNGTNWVLQNAQQPAVVLLLLYAPSNEVVDGVVDQLASAGLFVVVGAGNSGVPACTVSPARSSQAVTVAPVNQSLYQLDTSNSGRCVDIFAPGGMVPSAGIGADDAVGIHSSANPAAAVVAGVAAQFLEARRSARPGEVRSFLFATSSKGLVEDTFNSPNRLIYNGPLLCSPQLQDRPARLNRQQGRRLEQETRGAESDAEIIVSELQVSQTQPDFSDCFDDFGDPSGFVYFLARTRAIVGRREMQVDVASASSLLTRDSFVINNGTGSVRCINPRTSDPCDGFIIQGTVPVSEAVQIEIEVTCEVPLEAVKDTFTGNRVPTTEPPPATAVLSDFRPAGKLYAVNMQYPSTRAETDATAPLIHLSFSEAVTGVTAADFSVELSPPGAGSIRNLFPLGQDSRHYLAELSLQPAYSGTVTVQYIGGSTDVDGNANTQVDPVSFFKQTTSLTAPTVAWDICPSEET